MLSIDWRTRLEVACARRGFAVQQSVPRTLGDRLPLRRDAPSDDLLDRFLDDVAEKGLQLYPAQEEAVLALLD